MKMKAMAGAALALALVAAPVAAQAGSGMGPGPRMGRGMRAGGPGAMERTPAEMVLQHREELGLTADQVRQLEAIQKRVAAENGPRWERLKAAFGDQAPADMTVEERQALRQKMQELQPVREEIRATNRKAGAEIHELLTDEQEATLRPLMHQGNRGGRGGGPGRGMHRGPGGGGR